MIPSIPKKTPSKPPVIKTPRPDENKVPKIPPKVPPEKPEIEDPERKPYKPTDDSPGL